MKFLKIVDNREVPGNIFSHHNFGMAGWLIIYRLFSYVNNLPGQIFGTGVQKGNNALKTENC
jgi:hypothetical protein